MEGGLDKDNGAYGSLFLNIVSEMRSSSPVWEDFCSKATKLHTSMKATLTAVAAFLDAFQKIADMATGSKGATKEIGTSLTRLCMRHKAIEAKLKKFTGTILENLVNPLQDCMEDWKKTVVQLDKERTKEYKKSKSEIKKCASDTVRLQKKVKKGKSDMQSRLESAMQDVNDRYILLEEQEKNAVRTAMIEERSRYCHFITCLKPFVDGEVSLLTEVHHLSEIMESLCGQADSPRALPPASEQVILDLKGSESGPWNLQQPRRRRGPRIFVKTPPSSPSSIGSRKSSMCSISSIASSSSGSAQSHSPCHNKNIQQQHAQLLGSGLRLTSVSSQDSGFTSQDTLFLRPTTPSSLNIQTQSSDNVSQGTDTPEIDSTPSTPSESYPNTPSATSTWTNWPNPPVPNTKTENGRPHTISSAYEKSHARPALTSNLFEPPAPATLPKPTTQNDNNEGKHDASVIKRDRPHSTMSVPYSRPSASINKMQPVLPPLGPKPKSRAVAPPKVPPIGEQPVYANLSELLPQHEMADLDKTPTNRDPSPGSVGGDMEGSSETLVLDPAQLRHPNKKYPGLDLSEAIRDLDNYTAALHGDFSPEHRRSKMQQNSMELAAAIKELELSTKALESSYSNTPTSPTTPGVGGDQGGGDPQSSQQSLGSSSGYGTMNSTPAGSEDTIASGEDFVDSELRELPDREKYFTIPRNSTLSSMYRAQFKRPASTAGIPMSAQGGGGALARRSSLNQPKPPPPVRRSSSITSSNNPAVLQKYPRATPPRQIAPPTIPNAHNNQAQQADGGQPNHRRSHSASGSSSGSEPAYAELQEIQRSIHARNQQSGQYGGGGGHGSQATTPQYALPVTNPGQTVGSTNVINSLNAKFSGPGGTNTVDSHQYNQAQSRVPGAGYPGLTQTQTSPPRAGGGGGPDFPDLPPPPSMEELQEMEKIYNVPNVQPKPQQQSQHPSVAQTQNNVQLRQVPQSPTAGGAPPGGVRQSLISEMKAGNKFRKMSSSGADSEC